MNSALFNLALSGYILAGIFYLIGQVFKSRKSGTTAVFLLSAGFLFHTLCLLTRWQEAGHFPVIGLYETLVFSAWCVVLVYLILEKISEFKFLGVPVSLSAILILGYTSILDKSMKPLMPALKATG